jgi:flagellin-like protein
MATRARRNKLSKNIKAIAPVVATVILVAVTLAVSITCGAWMGGLTYSFAKNDQFTVNSVVFTGTSPNYNGINTSIQNTGSSSWTVGSPGHINSASNVVVTASGAANTLTAAAGKTIYVQLAYTCTSGNQYTVTLLMTDGNRISYVATAP